MSKRKTNNDATETKPAKKTKTEKEEDFEPTWQNFELLSQEACIDHNTAKSLIDLFEEGNTIPFIARYRRNIIGNMTPEDLRLVKESYENISFLKSKLKTVVKTLHKTGQFNDNIRKSLGSVKTMEELEHVYAPFKPESKRSLSERAKAIGLDKPANNILNNVKEEFLADYINKKTKGLSNIEEIEKGIIHIIAAVMASDTEILSKVRELRTNHYFFIETKQAACSKKENTATKLDNNKKPVDDSKYRLYFDFKITSDNIKPHQVLAINRGESQKVLSVKLCIPDFISNKFSNVCTSRYLRGSSSSIQRNRIINEAIKDCYSRLVQPLLIREVRSTLKQMAEKASIEMFSKNLKQLLLAKPIKGKLILGIDPGFSNGCKLALISETGSLLLHNVVYPFKKFKEAKEEATNIIANILHEYNCDLIAIGNGTACRETESWISDLISYKVFSPLNVTYTIVNEDGASIYSCSKEAKKEFPDLDPNVVSAVSLARRVQEPLAELVKVEPQHLGVGMYQHDLKKKQLDEALNEVISECVSFVGVDLNTASQCLLKGIAGLSEKRAAQIIEHREKNGPFTYRKEILKIKGIGEKIFQQCIGFLRVGPVKADEEETFYDNSETTKLDRTIIHPESYKVAKKLLKEWKLKESDIGSDEFIDKMKNISSSLDFDELASKLKTDKESIELIVNALGRPLSYDLRSEYNITPLFKKCLKSIDDLKPGSVLSGRISNITSFGCFVDIGVHTNGLIHVSKMRGVDLQIGDRVEVEVIDVEIERKRIGLKFIKIIDG